MPDVYSTIATSDLDPAVAAQLANAMELRATDEAQQEFLRSYLDDLQLPAGARVLEIGCGTGAISRVIARRPEIDEVVGVDPSAYLLEKAHELSAGIDNLTFQQADGRDLPFADAMFDAVVLHTVLSHIPGSDLVLAQAFRVLRTGGSLAAFDGDYATMTVATSELDPLQNCVAAMRENYVNDPWLIRKLPLLVQQTGFIDSRMHSYGYVQITDPNYMLTIVDRGAD